MMRECSKRLESHDSKEGASLNPVITRVLIVEEAGEHAETMLRVVETRGCSARRVSATDEAETAIEEFEPQIVLVDLDLRRQVGINLLRHVNAVKPETVCLAMTDRTELESAVLSLRTGASDYFHKSIEVPDFLAILDKSIEQARLKRLREDAETALNVRNRELEEFNQRLRGIVRSAGRFTACHRLSEIGPIFLDEFAKNLGAEGGSIFLCQEGGLRLVHSLDRGHVPDFITFPLRKGSFFDNAIRDRQPSLIEDISVHRKAVSSGWKGYKNGSLLIVPLFDDTGNNIGIVSLHNKTIPPFSPQDRELALIMASLSTEVHRALQVTQSLQDSEERYRSLTEDVLDSSAAGLFILDSKFRVVWVNWALEQYFNLRSDDVAGMEAKCLVEERLKTLFEDPETFAEKVLATYEDNSKTECFECHILPAPGREDRWLEHRSHPIGSGLYSGGRIEHYYDITQRKKAESERKLLASALEQAAETVVIAERDGTIQYVNPAFERMTGFSRDEVLGTNARLLLSPRHDDAFIDRLWKIVTEGEVWSGRFSNEKKDGTSYEEEAMVSPLRDDRGEITHFISVIRDITQELALEEQLRQSQKMEGIGQLAGGIAHDFNNLLVAIIGYADIGLMATPEGEPLNFQLSQIRKAANRAAALTRQLLEFSRQQVVQPVNLDLNDVIAELMEMLRRLIGENIELGILPGHQLDTIHAGRGQIEQVLINLCVNARDAMPEGGRISISTENVQLSPEEVGDDAGPEDGKFVLLKVSDTGEGIPPETLQHIFEPFFTTKGVGKGTGLGLATVYRIVKQHRGVLRVDSSVGEGTTFKINFPVVEPEASREEQSTLDAAPGGKETILVVEDEEFVRELMMQLLTEAGYTVLTAIDGETALRTFEAECARIQMVILDIVLPKLSGREVYDRMRALRPDLPILFTSGYSPGDNYASVFLEEDKNFIPKPFEVSKFLQKVRELFDS